jgi:hypothetical protein
MAAWSNPGSAPRPNEEIAPKDLAKALGGDTLNTLSKHNGPTRKGVTLVEAAFGRGPDGWPKSEDQPQLPATVRRASDIGRSASPALGTSSRSAFGLRSAG